MESYMFLSVLGSSCFQTTVILTRTAKKPSLGEVQVVRLRITDLHMVSAFSCNFTGQRMSLCHCFSQQGGMRVATYLTQLSRLSLEKIMEEVHHEFDGWELAQKLCTWVVLAVAWHVYTDILTRYIHVSDI